MDRPLGGRHAAVIPALPEEYDSSLPIGDYYPTQSERERRIREAGGVPELSRYISGNSHYPRHVHLQAERLKDQTSQQLRELSASGQHQVAPQTPAQLVSSADRTLQVLDGPATGGNLQSSTDVTPVAATIASIMNAFPAVRASTPTTPTPTH